MFKQTMIIAGVARSGTSWLGELVNSSPAVAYRFQPLFSYAFKDYVNIDSPRARYAEFLQGIYESRDPFLLQSDKRAEGIYPSFQKDPVARHLVLKKARYHYLHIRFLSYFSNLKLAAIVRHPGAVLASWMANPKEFPPSSDPLQEWRHGACKNEGRPENFFGFNKWREATNIFLDLQSAFPDRARVFRYEDLVDRTEEVTAEIFQFAGLELGRQTAEFISACNSRHNESPYAVYKQKAVRNRWKDTLDPRIIADIEQELTGTRLEQFLA